MGVIMHWALGDAVAVANPAWAGRYILCRTGQCFAEVPFRVRNTSYEEYLHLLARPSHLLSPILTRSIFVPSTFAPGAPTTEFPSSLAWRLNAMIDSGLPLSSPRGGHEVVICHAVASRSTIATPRGSSAIFLSSSTRSSGSSLEWQIYS
jgi:hypothetical protein